MNNFYGIVGAAFKKNAGVGHDELAKFEVLMGGRLPDDYKDFLQWSNGGEGNIGALYVSIWTIDKVLKLNTSYSISTRLGKRFIGIGTDGGDYCFALDLRAADNAFVVLPFGALADSEIKRLAKSMVDGLISMRDRNITGDDL